MSDVTPRFKEPKKEPARRAWNSTLPATTKRVNPKTKRATKDDRTFKSGHRSELCERCRQRPAQDASHRGTRKQRPDLRGDPSNRDDLCRPCHVLVESDIELAEREGWRLSETYEAANADPMAKVQRQLEG